MTLVFLHIPKTAGQTVHHELVRIVGTEAVSPVRVHSQARAESQMPAGYRLYSGHIDWTGLDLLPDDRFVFTVLRDPRERIASFYFYLLKEAATLGPEALSRPENTGKRMILECTAEDYFFGNGPDWQNFLRDHYDNFYCNYFATRRMRGRASVAQLTPAELLDQAIVNAGAIDRIYRLEDLQVLERDIARICGADIRVAGRYVNAGLFAQDERRWPRLVARIGSDRLVRGLEAFAELDAILMERLDFAA